MKKASEYRQHAEECRSLAAQMQQGEQRDQLLKMAETWESLANDRERWSRNLRSVTEGNPSDGQDRSGR